MQHFLVDLGRRRVHQRLDLPEWKHEAEQPLLTPSQAALLALGKMLTRIKEPLSDEGINTQLDIMFGEGVVPKYQWFLLGEKASLSGYDIADLETYFFGGNEHGYGNIELHPGPRGTWLRIRNAEERCVNFSLDGKRYRIAKAIHYTKSNELVATFPI